MLASYSLTELWSPLLDTTQRQKLSSSAMAQLTRAVPAVSPGTHVQLQRKSSMLIIILYMHLHVYYMHFRAN